MTNCPNTDRLAELLADGSDDLSARAHVQSCARCREELRILRELPAMFEAEVRVSEHVVKRTLLTIDALPAPAPAREPARGVPLALTWLLGTVTAAGAVLAGELPSGAGVTELLVYSTCVGLAAVVLRARSQDSSHEPGSGPARFG